MPATNSQSEPSDNEELVAYLDGELPPEVCRIVEERLARDDGYRQQLRDLDQAWEALSVLPPATVDDGFARTTIELACVAAEEDLSQRKSQFEVESRSRAWWWVAGAVAAAAIGFVIVRAIIVHRNDAILADLPVIEQANALSHIENIEFLRQLSKAVSTDEFVKDDTAFKNELADFKKASAESLGERRAWVNSLTSEQKATLANRARAFIETQQQPEEKNRLRKLANDVSHDTDLQPTLVAYGQWLARQSGADQQKLRDDTPGLSTEEHVAVIEQATREQGARHLSEKDAATLRREILELAKEKKAEVVERIPPGREHDRVASMDVTKAFPALFIVGYVLRNGESGEATVNELLSKLSPEAQEHWNKLGRGRRERGMQMWVWIGDALPTKRGPEELEQFFASDKLTPEERQKLLDMSRSEMKNRLEQLYMSSELGVDNRMPFFRDFGDGGRGSRGGGPFDARGPGIRPDFRPDGDRDPRFGPGGPPPGEPRFDRDRPRDGGPPGPGDQRGMRPEDRPENGRDHGRSRRPPNDGRPPDGPPLGEEPPPPPEKPSDN